MERKTRSGTVSDKKSIDYEEDNSSVSIQSISNDLKIIIDKLNSVEVEVKNMKLEQTGIVKSIESCKLSIDDIKTAVQRIDSDVANCNKQINILSDENKSLKKELINVKLDCNSLQQYTKKDCIDVIGIPLKRGENLFSLLGDISLKIGFQFREDMISNCHRLRRREGSYRSENPKIIYKFNRNIDKQAFLKLTKEKCTLCLSELGWEGNESKIFINETMSPYNRLMF